MHKRHGPVLNHRRINDALSLVAAVLAIYILAIPVIPQITLWWHKRTDTTGGHVYQTKLLDEDTESVNVQDLKPIPKENRLVIPQIQLDQEIHEGPYANTLSKGLWRKPYTKTPDQGGNTVVVGHRMTYSNPSTFYHLDKLKIGDRFSVYWNSEEYVYEVVNTRVVSAIEVSVENNTEDARLTLYTCTPLWNPTKRLVIESKLLESYMEQPQ